MKDLLLLIEETSCGEGWMRITPVYQAAIAASKGVPKEKLLLVEEMDDEEIRSYFDLMNEMWIEQGYDKHVTKVHARVIEDIEAKKWKVYFKKSWMHSEPMLRHGVNTFKGFIQRSLMPDWKREENEGWTIEFPQLPEQPVSAVPAKQSEIPDDDGA
jgi:hypothetical protein